MHTIAQSIIRFYEHDAKKVREIVRNARATAAQADWNHFMKYYYDAYEKALEEINIDN